MNANPATQGTYSPELYAAFLNYSQMLEQIQYRTNPALKKLTKPQYFRGYCLARLIEEGNVKLALEILNTIPPNDVELLPETNYDYLVTMDNAVKARSLELLKILHERSIGECTKNAMDVAAKNGDLDIIRFLHENRTEGCSVRAFKNAKKYKCDDVLKYLEEHCQADKAIKEPRQIPVRNVLDDFVGDFYSEPKRDPACTIQ
ncbi:hypothetical protein THRCLA_11991 [Thraustotheca clavata]|uniref:Uncharacterized protein n=1 Tax=Thraustotheca clavata TaxID=74557 RepID=A0A1V9Y4B0_9STRA|nr:hypothetical protein THRCLA_11991 [Thraustotheca clavata]